MHNPLNNDNIPDRDADITESSLKREHIPSVLPREYSQAHQKSVARLLATLFSVGVALGSGLGYGFSQWVPAANQQKPTVQTEVRHVSRVEYERLKLGMSLAEVEAILDRGIEINRSAKSVSFIWENQDSSRITIIFEDGKLTSKVQSGLK